MLIHKFYLIAVRGANKRLSSNLLMQKTTTGELTAFNSDGYTLGTGDNVNADLVIIMYHGTESSRNYWFS